MFPTLYYFIFQPLEAYLKAVGVDMISLLAKNDFLNLLKEFGVNANI